MFSSTSIASLGTRTAYFESLGIQERSILLLEALETAKAADASIYFPTEKIVPRLMKIKPAIVTTIIDAFHRLQQQQSRDSKNEVMPRSQEDQIFGGSVVLIQQDDTTTVIPLQYRDVAMYTQQDIEKKLEAVRELLMEQWDIVQRERAQLKASIAELEKTIENHTVVGDEKLREQLRASIATYNAWYSNTEQDLAIDGEALCATITRLATYQKLQDYLDTPWQGFRAAQGYANAGEDQKLAIDKLRDLIRSSVIDTTLLEKLTKMKASLKLCTARWAQINSLGLMSMMDMAIALGYPEFQYLANSTFPAGNVHFLKDKTFKGAYLLLLSTPYVCDVCTTGIPMLGSQLSKMIKEAGGDIDPCSINAIYLPAVEDLQAERLPQDIINRVVVKCPQEDRIYLDNRGKINAITKRMSRPYQDTSERVISPFSNTEIDHTTIEGSSCFCRIKIIQIL